MPETSFSTCLTWQVIDSGGHETAWIEAGDDRLTARGRAVGITPEPYWISYELQTGPGWVTRELRVRAESAAGVRELLLGHDGSGRWSVDGVARPELDGALDCDLGLCPLTNSMPVLRHRLHREPGEREFLMAWVRVPELTVHRSPQTYTTRSVDEPGGGALIRYTSGEFRRDITVDGDGFVVDYPGLARRIATVRG
ncbi:putative glycolipid-binding domain-containing protein [Streptomyces yaizuensis]|uniref:Glycolipid-binding domain-containing protein n=1 Tax=Streptomyces yaizuensis TaxID=2989713 RepID=A0ABQ5P376_9ACTN|nr:putative glycolipid-binding domain-containing protein [Streptomyces sp. YSPA8]GLF97053.1 putative glycolipid-binding domain-containing protein [Streptomyces sp. YSPA8]